MYQNRTCDFPKSPHLPLFSIHRFSASDVVVQRQCNTQLWAKHSALFPPVRITLPLCHLLYLLRIFPPLHLPQKSTRGETPRWKIASQPLSSIISLAIQAAGTFLFSTPPTLSPNVIHLRLSAPYFFCSLKLSTKCSSSL